MTSSLARMADASWLNYAGRVPTSEAWSLSATSQPRSLPPLRGAPPATHEIKPQYSKDRQYAVRCRERLGDSLLRRCHPAVSVPITRSAVSRALNLKQAI